MKKQLWNYVWVSAKRSLRRAMAPVLVLLSPTVFSQTYTWKSVNLQGMGYVTGLVVHPNTTLAPNLLYARTDVGGAYRYSASNNSWVPLMDQYGPLDAGKTRIESIAIDPGNVNTVYVAVVEGDVFATAIVGDILKSTDQGAHWTSTGFSTNQVYTGGNDYFRGSSGERLRVDPNNSNVLYFGSRKHGLWYKNGSGTWTHVVNGLPSTPGDPGYTFVVFDKNSGTTGGSTNTIYVGVYGSGVWRTTDAGSNWSRIGWDTNPLRADVGSDGTLYVTFGGNEAAYSGPGAARKYANGSWTDITPAAIGTSKSYSGISVDPNNPNNVAVTTNQADMAYSTDKGANWASKPVTFSSYPSYFWTSTWYKWGTSALVIDPNDATGKRVWMTDGFAVSRTNDYTADSPSWTTVMNNLEEYCATSIKTPPKVGGAQLFTTQLDGIGNRVADKTIVPATRYNTVNTTVSAATGLDYCMTQPDYLAYVGLDETNSDRLTGFSNDNGVTWQAFGSTTPGRGGVIAMSATNPQKMAWFPINSSGTGFSYTTNGGGSWSTCAGAPSTSWFRGSDYWSGQTLVADRVNGDKFYLLHQNGSGGAEFYVSTNGGANWSKTAATFAGYRSYSVSACVKANPYVEGDLLVTTVPNQNVSATSLPDYKLYRSTNSGASFEVVSSVTCAYAATFAKGTSSTMPAIYIYGRVGSATKEGIYRSIDNGSSWTLVSNPDEQRFLGVSYMEGDLLTNDLVYIIPGGCRGFIYGAPSGTTNSLREPENPANAIAGLSYTYYEGIWSTVPTFSSLPAAETGNVTTVDLSPRNRDDQFAFQYQGYVNVPTDGTYTFYTSSDDGSQLFIGTTKVVDNDGLHPTQERSGTIDLKAGKHAITITFFEQGGDQVLSASYAGPTLDKQLIPASALYRTSAAARPSLESVHQETPGNELSVYPNPGSQVLHLQTSANLAQARFSLVDPHGRVTLLSLSERTEQGGQVDVSGVRPGVYVLRIQTATATFTKRVIID